MKSLFSVNIFASEATESLNTIFHTEHSFFRINVYLLWWSLSHTQVGLMLVCGNIFHKSSKEPKSQWFWSIVYCIDETDPTKFGWLNTHVDPDLINGKVNFGFLYFCMRECLNIWFHRHCLSKDITIKMWLTQRIILDVKSPRISLIVWPLIDVTNILKSKYARQALQVWNLSQMVKVANCVCL